MLLVLGGAAWGLPGFRPATNQPFMLQDGLSSRLPVLGTLQEKIEFRDLGFRSLSNGRLELRTSEGAPLLVRGMPQVPLSVRRYLLPLGKTAVARLENVQLEESTEAVALPKTPEPYVWAKFARLPNLSGRTGAYFPGKLVSSAVSEGELVVSVYPAQVELATGKVMVVRSADLKIDYSDAPRELTVRDIWAPTEIIITSEALRKAAERLQNFHSQILKLKSEIVTVESLAANEPPIDEVELPDGYKKTEEPWDTLVRRWDPKKKEGYDYLSARKIIHYLQDKMRTGTATKYVTLLGDATQVPPSYYISIHGDETQIGVTDQCYAAKNQCMEPKFAVGRLPFQSEEQLQIYLDKAQRWMETSVGAKSELSLFGGKAFTSDVFIGELGVLKTVNVAQDDWRGVKKYFRTRRNYTKANVLDLVRGKQESSFIYYLDHGMGNQWYVEDEFVTSKEILKAADSGGVNPLIVSIACTNAAFDEKTSAESILSDPTAGDVSVGVALLRSRAGAVAYLGSARPALGVPVYNFDKGGNLNLSGSTYGLQMFDTFFAKYRDARQGRLGDLILQMNRAYLNENGNDMKEEGNRWTYFNVELLGDPALVLPDRGAGEKVAHLPLSTLETKTVGGIIPLLKWESGQGLSIPFTADVSVMATLLRMPKGFGKEEAIDSHLLAAGGDYPVDLSDAQAPGTYFLRLENSEGVPFERQVWFKVR